MIGGHIMYQILTIQINGILSPIENKYHSTKENAEKRLEHLKSVYNHSNLFIVKR
jgi:hypothetical protein